MKTKSHARGTALARAAFHPGGQMSRLIFPLLMAVVGVGVLLSLGVWQVQRLDWKATSLAAITARIADAPVALPQRPDPDQDKYLPVVAVGALAGPELFILTSHDGAPGYRVIAAFETAGRRVMADLGFITLEAKSTPRVTADLTLTGHLHWPQEVDGWTPAPDGDLWFARDVPAMAAALGTEPALIVVAAMSGADLGVTPLPIDTGDIPNDHLGYAITWFGLAFVWAVMSGFFAVRMARAPRMA